MAVRHRRVSAPPRKNARCTRWRKRSTRRRIPRNRRKRLAQPGAGPSAGSAQGGAGKQPGDVIDAEYVDVDDKKAPN
jgi:hypothetical protein